MENEAVEIINYRGHNINIFQDFDCQSPEDWSDDNIFLVNYHRDFEVRKNDIITEDNVRDWYSGEKIEQSKDYHIFMLSCLVHSGVWLSLDYSFSCDGDGWDTSHVGVIMVSKKEARTKKKALTIAEELLKSWNDCLSGNVYGFMIDDNGDSCWGFYGDYTKSGLIEEAKDRIDYEVEKATKKHLKRLKAQIKNNVPLEKRMALEV